MRNLTLILIFILAATCSLCQLQNGKELSIHYNDEALKISNTCDLSDSPKLKIVFQYLDSAIYYDRECYVAYRNKINFLLLSKNSPEALRLLIFLIQKKYSVAENLMVKGFIYEKNNDSINAKEMYKQAISEYKTRIGKEPDNISNQVNLIFSEFILDPDNKTALVKLNSLNNDNEGRILIDATKELIENFKRNDFLNYY